MKLQYWYILYGKNLFYLSFFYCVCVQILKIHKNDSKLAFAISVNRKKISLHLKYYFLPIVPSFPFGKIHAHTNTNKPSRIMTKIELYLRPLITLTNPSIKNVAFVGGRGAAKPWGEWEEDALEFSRAFVLASRVKTARMAALPRKLSHARKQFCQLTGPLKMLQKFSSALNSCLGS